MRGKGKPHVLVFDVKEGRSFETGTDNVAVETDFNRVAVDGLEPDAVEKAIAGFESDIAPAIIRIIAAESLGSEEDRVALVNLICALAIRNPRLRETTRDFHEQVATKMLMAMLATPERWAAQLKKLPEGMSEDPAASYGNMKKFVQEKQWKIDVPTTRHIQLELTSFDKILPYLLDRKWRLLRASPGSGGFITADHPVVLTWSDPQMRGLPVGYGLRGTAVIFPLCIRLAFVGLFEEGEETVVSVRDDYVASLNGALIANAERHIIARDAKFKFSMQPGEVPLEGSRLVGDERFQLRRDGTS